MSSPSEEETNIRRGRPADLADTSKLLSGAGLPTADLAGAQEFQTWVFDDRGSIVGVIGLERFGGAALLRSLAVAPERRNRGPGRRLGVPTRRWADSVTPHPPLGDHGEG